MTSASGEDPKLLKTAIDWAIKWKEDSTKSCNFYDLIIKQYSVKEVIKIILLRWKQIKNESSTKDWFLITKTCMN